MNRLDRFFSVTSQSQPDTRPRDTVPLMSWAGPKTGSYRSSPLPILRSLEFPYIRRDTNAFISQHTTHRASSSHFCPVIRENPIGETRKDARRLDSDGRVTVELHGAKVSCHDFVDNQVRLQLFALAYNLGNFLRRLALPRSVKTWSLRTLRERLVKLGAKGSSIPGMWRSRWLQ